MKSIKPHVLAAALLLLLCAGCTTTAPAPAAPAAQVRAGENLLKSFIANDAQAFLKELPPQVAEEFGENGFKNTRDSMLKQLGEPRSYEFVFNLEHPSFTVSIWKITFERENADRSRTIRQQTLFRAVSGQLDGQNRLLAFNFF